MSTEPQPKRVSGVRAKYSPGLATRICEEIAKGRSLREICDTESWAPTEAAFRQWTIGLAGMSESEADALSSQYARAMERRCDVLAEQALVVAAGAKGDDAQAKRLHFDAIRWFTGKVAPKRYGDRVGLEHSGELNVNIADSIARLRAAQQKKV